VSRRVGRGRVVPGLSDAIATDARAFAGRWPTPDAVATADAAERGETLQVDGTTVWHALFAAKSPLADRFFKDENAYVLTAPDALEIEAT
jgi:hypothetical protein